MVLQIHLHLTCDNYCRNKYGVLEMLVIRPKEKSVYYSRLKVWNAIILIAFHNLQYMSCAIT